MILYTSVYPSSTVSQSRAGVAKSYSHVLKALHESSTAKYLLKSVSFALFSLSTSK